VDIKVKYKTFTYQHAVMEYLQFEPASWWKRVVPFLHKGNFVFINGFGDPCQNHLQLLQMVANRGYTVYALNLPGHGHSEPLPVISWDNLGNLVVEFCRHVKIRRPILSGFSLGGGIALRLADDPYIKPKSVRVIAPVCKSLPVVQPSTLGGILKTAIHTAEEMLQHDKPLPFNHHPSKYIWHRYIPIFSKVKPLSTNLTTPLNVVVLEHDAVITSEAVNSVLRGLTSASIKLMPGLAHDIYYISEAQTQQLVNLLLG
jgi:alpha-beta hydrolase superfamily lysophospholipase